MIPGNKCDEKGQQHVVDFGLHEKRFFCIKCNTRIGKHEKGPFRSTGLFEDYLVHQQTKKIMNLFFEDTWEF